MKTLYFFIGTEAELMKMYATIFEAKKRGYETIIVSNGQNIINDSPFLKIIDEKVKLDLTMYAPKKKGMKYYLKWFYKTKKLGVEEFKKIKKKDNFKNSLMFVHGDTLSTLMGSMIAKKVKLPYAHVESGLMSFNLLSPFPEEIDRFLSSKKSVINFCQNEEALISARKRFKGKAVCTIYNTGIETLYYALEEGKKQKLKLPVDDKYFVYVLHRQENLLNENFIKTITEHILNLSSKIKCLFIFHEQTREAMEKFKVWDKFKNNKNIIIIGRQDYINFINIIKNCEFVVGDGCGNQQEFYYMGKPYLIMRTKVEKGSEGLNHNALPFDNNFDNIDNFYLNYKKYIKSPIKMEQNPSKIIMDTIDKYFENVKE